VFAFVGRRPGAAPTSETARALQSHCLEALAYYKAPGYIAFREELPRTASQKLARAEIKALAAQALAGGPRPPGPQPATDLAFDLRDLKKRRG
jgi:acyl-coenzyme A synthetase/AMP-(fatty) acid ligase